jgi:hypothetical protein
MARLLALLSALALAGCATPTDNIETARSLVLTYIGHDVGTLGPFSHHATRELGLLAENHRKDAVAELERGAEGFLIIEPDQAKPNRIVLIHHGKIVGDFPTISKEAN